MFGDNANIPTCAVDLASQLPYSHKWQSTLSLLVLLSIELSVDGSGKHIGVTSVVFYNEKQWTL